MKQWMLKIAMGLCLSCYGGEAMASTFLEQVQMLQREQALEEWAKQHPEKAQELYNGLLSYALFARLHDVPPLIANPLEVLNNLVETIPETEDKHHSFDLLQQADFHNHILAFDSLESGSHSLPGALMHMGQLYLYRVDHLPQLESPPDFAYELQDRLGFIAGMEEGESFSPDILLFKFYLSAFQSRNAEALAEVAQDAEEHGLLALALLAQLELGTALSKSAPQAAETAFQTALSQARSLNSPILEFRALLSLAYHSQSAKFAQTAKNLLDQQPAGFTQNYLQKLWADYLLQIGQIDEARSLYAQLASQNTPWLQIWLIRTFAQIRDVHQLPLIETWLDHSHPLVSTNALQAWLALTPSDQQEQALERLIQGLSHEQLGFLLARLPISSGTAPGLVSRARDLLKSSEPQLALTAMAYLSKRQIYDPEMLKGLDKPETRQETLMLLRPLADKLPDNKLTPWLADPEVHLDVLYLLVSKGARKQLKDFLSLWSQEAFEHDSQLYRHLSDLLDKGQIAWPEWRQALETAEAASDQKLTSALFHSLRYLEALPEAGCKELEKLLDHPSPAIQTHAISLLNQCAHTPKRSQRIGTMAQGLSKTELNQTVLTYLAEESDPQWLPLFQQALQSDDERLRHAAFSYLARVEPSSALAYLTKTSEINHNEMSTLLDMLLSSGLPAEQIKPWLKTVLKSVSAALRKDLLSVILPGYVDYLDAALINEYLRQPDLSENLLQLAIERPVLLEAETLKVWLHSQDLERQVKALILAEKKGARELVQDLIPLLKDSRAIDKVYLNQIQYAYYIPGQTFTVRELALRTLTELDQEAAWPWVIQFLQDPAPALQNIAVMLLKQANAPVLSQAQLAPLLQQADPALRFTALDLHHHQLITAGKTGLPLQTWLAFLAEPSATLRLEALNKLSDYPDLTAELITPFTHDPDSKVRQRAQSLFNQITGTQQKLSPRELLEQSLEEPHLIWIYLDDNPPDADREALYSELLKLLKQPNLDEMHFSNLVQSLKDIKGPAAVPDLISLLNYGQVQEDHFRGAIRAEQIPLFAKLVKEAQNPEHVALGIKMLHQLEATEQLPLIIPLLERQDEVQPAAIAFVGRYGSSADKAQLIKLLGTQKRYLAFEALKETAIPDYFDEVLSLIKQSPDNQQAMLLAGHWRIQEARPLLEQALLSPEALYPETAAKALGQLGDPASLPALQQALQLQPAYLELIEALYALGDSANAGDALKILLERANSYEQAYGLELIAEFRDRSLLPAVLRLLASRELAHIRRHGRQSLKAGEIGMFASSALREITTVEDVPTLIELLPRLNKQRQQDVQELLLTISKRYPVWPESVLQQLKALSLKDDQLIRSTAQTWIKQMQP